MLIFVFTSVPLLFISGISWPGAAIPPFWKYVSYIFPSTFGINGFVKINNMGATLSEVAFEYTLAVGVDARRIEDRRAQRRDRGPEREIHILRFDTVIIMRFFSHVIDI